MDQLVETRSSSVSPVPVSPGSVSLLGSVSSGVGSGSGEGEAGSGEGVAGTGVGVLVGLGVGVGVLGLGVGVADSGVTGIQTLADGDVGWSRDVHLLSELHPSPDVDLPVFEQGRADPTEFAGTLFHGKVLLEVDRGGSGVDREVGRVHIRRDGK